MTYFHKIAFLACRIISKVALISLAPYSVNKVAERTGSIMNDLITDRTPLVIAAEINTIRHQTGKILLAGAIEIGRRLKEAKDLLSLWRMGQVVEGIGQLLSANGR